MSLIVETGTGSALSEAYATVEYCDNYHALIGNTLWATLQTIEKEQALRRSASFMCQLYRLQWKGVRVNTTQALDWPRVYAAVQDVAYTEFIDSDIVPVLVQKANAELALLAAAGDLNPTKSQAVLSKQVGPLKVVYDTASPQGKQYSAINDILAPLLGGLSGSMNVKLRRV